MVVAAAVGVAVIVSMAVACGGFPVIVIVSTTVACGWFALVCPIMTVIVTLRVTVIMLAAVVAIVTSVAGVAAVVMVLAHASLPLEGSAICSSISLRTSLIWASAAE
ncbi:UNVERIFIED_ORG: hypothetical protein JN05_04328 [Zoogloea ramigera]